MIKVLYAGLYTSIQDFGRIGYQHYGVPVSGVMDRRAAKLANALVGNKDDAAVLEITMSGPKLSFETNTTIAITGAVLHPSINGKTIENNRFISVKQGDILSFGRLLAGFRCYLAVSGGFQTQDSLGSKSMYNGITQCSTLKKDAILKINQHTAQHQKQFSGLKVNDDYLKTSLLEVLPGPEFDSLTSIQKEKLFSEAFKVSKDNNRMAYQLEELLENNLAAIITSPVIPGTVQLTPSGKLIILMRDCQTTGGYPRVLQLTEASIDVLAQKYTGSNVNFRIRT